MAYSSNGPAFLQFSFAALPLAFCSLRKTILLHCPIVHERRRQNFSIEAVWRPARSHCPQTETPNSN
jgi:hypothetical protein